MASTFRSFVQTIKRHEVKSNESVVYYGPFDVCPVVNVKSRAEALRVVDDEKMTLFSSTTNPDGYWGQAYIHPSKGLVRLVVDDEHQKGSNPLNQARGPYTNVPLSCLLYTSPSPRDS
eukprot:TRINITY_DN63564_c0_g1_i1.p1 TRINITY_DN63564_c0_g1~~TRINITY_DN63564_c0_g1_i1.p1  ORF type:complete len:118 (-),score=5.12 TRINITY_DN63564_c0_g1_i1:59-412(-)